MIGVLRWHDGSHAVSCPRSCHGNNLGMQWHDRREAVEQRLHTVASSQSCRGMKTVNPLNGRRHTWQERQALLCMMGRLPSKDGRPACGGRGPCWRRLPAMKTRAAVMHTHDCVPRLYEHRHPVGARRHSTGRRSPSAGERGASGPMDAVLRVRSAAVHGMGACRAPDGAASGVDDAGSPGAARVSPRRTQSPSG